MDENLQKVAELDRRFCEEMQAVSGFPIGLAVSGGGDSLALLVMASKWADLFCRDLKVVTIDHHLRSDSRTEANYVKTMADSLGHSHDILDWKYEATTGNFQAAASQARKQLISAWAKKKCIHTVLLGHTANDQAETFLMRLARGSGVDGLACMNRSKKLYDIEWFRPLLSFQREDLRHYLNFQNIKWFDDPSNENLRYTRVKVRKVLRELEILGVKQRVFLETAKRMDQAKEVLNDVAREAGEQYLRLREWGDIEVDKKLFEVTRHETYLRLLAHIIKSISGNIYRTRLSELKQFALALNESTFKARTIGGIIARSLNEKTLVLRREPRVPTFIKHAPARNFIWDSRWAISLVKNKLGVSEKIGPLGTFGLSQIRPKVPASIPTEGLISLPTLFREERVVASPVLNFGEGFDCSLAYTKLDLINSLVTH